MSACAARNLDGALCDYAPEHRHCISCASVVLGDRAICLHHGAGEGDGWHLNNRALCNFIHRKIAAPRLSEADRGDYAELSA